MNYLGQLFLRKSTIGYGCLVLLGSVSVAGVAELELKHQIFSKWVGNFTKGIREGISSSSSPTTSQGQAITATQVFGPFVIAGEAVAGAAQTVWPFIKGTYDILKTLKTNTADWWKGIKSFFTSLMEPEIFKRIFENIHQKIWNILVFVVEGKKEAGTFIGLFGGDKKDKTLLMGKLLLGQEIPNAKNFKVQPNVFHHLFSKWMDKPKEIAEKIDRLLSKSIDTLTEKLKSQQDSSGHVYLLDIPTVDAYLETREGWHENIFMDIWKRKIREKITTGKDDSSNAKQWIQNLSK